jgi:hypothetical protein
MNESDGKRGDEPDDEFYFAYSASLRIFGVIPAMDELTRRLGVLPTSSHRKGDSRAPRSQPYQHDMWFYRVSIEKDVPLHVHIDELWNIFRLRRDYLLELQKSLTVDVFLGYRTDCRTAGVEVPYQSLEIFRELQVPFQLSIILT